MSDPEQKFVGILSDNRDGKSFADLTGNLIIETGDSMFVDFTKDKILIFGSHCETSFLNIVSALALMRKLESQGMIYVVPHSLSVLRLLIHGNMVISDIGVDGQQYYADQGKFRLSHPFENPVCNGAKCECFKIIKNNIAQEICSRLASDIYPTSDLIDFVNNGYLTKDERQFKKTIFKTNLSILIAIAALVLSPALTTCYSNKHGVTTINSDQLDSLVHRLDIVATTTKTYLNFCPNQRNSKINEPKSDNPTKERK